MVEDIKRYFQDRFENNNLCEVGFEDKDIIEFKQKRWKDVRVGDIIKVYENQYFPCDMLLINKTYEIACDEKNELIYVFNGSIKMSELLTIGLSEE